MKHKRVQNRNSPRHINETTWYYLNRGSVTLVAEARNADKEHVATIQLLLTRTRLKNMLAEIG